jgi:hypothetical protein
MRPASWGTWVARTLVAKAESCIENASFTHSGGLPRAECRPGRRGEVGGDLPAECPEVAEHCHHLGYDAATPDVHVPERPADDHSECPMVTK